MLPSTSIPEEQHLTRHLSFLIIILMIINDKQAFIHCLPYSLYYGSYINFLIYFLPYLKFNTFEFSKALDQQSNWLRIYILLYLWIYKWFKNFCK